MFHPLAIQRWSYSSLYLIDEQLILCSIKRSTYFTLTIVSNAGLAEPAHVEVETEQRALEEDDQSERDHTAELRQGVADGRAALGEPR